MKLNFRKIEDLIHVDLDYGEYSCESIRRKAKRQPFKLHLNGFQARLTMEEIECLKESCQDALSEFRLRSRLSEELREIDEKERI